MTFLLCIIHQLADYVWRWGQIYILDALLRYVPETHADAELIGERISVQLQHANSAVVLTTIKVLLFLMNYMDNKKLVDHICKKMGPPLGNASRGLTVLLFADSCGGCPAQ